MKTRDLITKLMNMSTENPSILDMEVNIPCDGGCNILSVEYVYVEDGKLILDC